MVTETGVATIGGRWTALPRLVRFFVIGGINTAFGYGAYALLLGLGLHYAGAALLGTIASVVFNFFTTGRLVFGRTARRSSPMRFAVVYGIVYVINVLLLIGLDWLGLNPYAAGLVLIVPMALVSYALMRRFVFGGRVGTD